ncbi:hypothetical protein MIND_00813000 [Mycena indigotica]|uniref:BTB domain-containing protein n=1 Tax=Mycena indigotica TaxID=2126181 RepID=A0A8H6SGR6_9AGAR|nr:uncharacterized protein MIND_00813000 [Mycena indigotica]KAF7298658.1 hypothetical protein MIND_00813000 [Mycena indigotica]
MPARFIIDSDGSTIRETREQSELPTRPRKRQRRDSWEYVGGYSDSDEQRAELPGPVEDDVEFYRENDSEADCVVRVGLVRFKVKSALLADISLVLRDILEEHPAGQVLVLVADPDEFRVLCWAIYADPSEVIEPPQDHESISRLLQLAAISRQFQCTPLLAAIKTTLLTAVSNPSFAASFSSPLFARLVETAISIKHDALLDVTIAAWASRIRVGEAPCIPAIIAADTHELPSLRGIAYYHHVQTMVAEQGTNQRGATTFQTEQLVKLSNGQVTRVLSGHWSLVSLCEQLKRTALPFLAGPDCTRGCTKVWVERWSVAAMSEKSFRIRAAALLTLLETMQQLMKADKEVKQGMCGECRKSAIAALEKRAKELEEGLADHFFGCL